MEAIIIILMVVLAGFSFALWKDGRPKNQDQPTDDGLQIREDAYVSFRFCGEVYETARMEGRACLGIRRGVYSCEEYAAVMNAGDEMMGTNPDIQCFFSNCHFARIRLWIPCADANSYESALLSAMDRMDAIRSEFESRVQRSLFVMTAPVFENILNKR